MTTTAPVREPTIDPDLRSLVPTLSDPERTQLEANLLADGCRDPLVVWAEEGVLLDGHNRKTICDAHGIDYELRELSLPDRTAARRWVIENQFGRRNLSPYQRAELALELKPLMAKEAKERQGTRSDLSDDIPAARPECSGDARDKAAEVAGVSGRTISRAEYVRERADETTQDKLRKGDTTINREYRKIKKAEARAERERRRARAAAHVDPEAADACRLICADIADAARHIEPESVDWIVTDPPYPKTYLELYDHLADLAAYALKPGGSLVAMVGQSYLPDIMARLGRRLRYHWTLAYLTPGGQAVQLWDRRVNTFWKPLLWYVNGDRTGDWVGDVCRSRANDNDKTHHRWGQSESGMADVLERLTEPGQTVLDPFMGAGTTGLVAVRMKRKFIGIDVDPECVNRAEKRITPTEEP